MTEVTPVGRVWRLSMYALCILMLLSGPGFLALSLMLDASVWAGVLIGGLLSWCLVPLGIVLWSDIGRTARGMRRLSMAGVPGTAEVSSVTPTRYDDRTRLQLKLWIKAPGIEP